MENSTTICIMTFSRRFDIFKQTLQSIREQSDIGIYVAVNGDYGKEFDNEYRIAMLNECLKYDNVYCNFYLTFRGCAKIWNDCIINCGSEHIIVTNDDVQMRHGFIPDFISHIEDTSVKELIRVNDSFSTFYINKQFMDSKGYFNEYYLGIGWEDFEFNERSKGGVYSSFHSDKYSNLYAEHLDLVDQHASIECGKYHRYNSLIYKQGPAHGVNFRPYEKSYMDNYHTFWTI